MMDTQAHAPSWQQATSNSVTPAPGNENLAPHSSGGTVIQRFLTVVRRFSDKLAVCDGAVQYTYGELAAQAAVVADAVENCATDPSKPVALLMEDRADTIVAILGVLLAGRFYTVVGPHLPKERIRDILQDAEPSLLLIDSKSTEEATRLSLPRGFLCRA